MVLTIEESAIVRGGRSCLRTQAAGQPVLLRLVHNGRIEGLSASQPIQVASSIIGGNGTFAGSVRVGGITVDNAQMNFETNATGSPDFTSSCFNTLQCRDRRHPQLHRQDEVEQRVPGWHAAHAAGLGAPTRGPADIDRTYRREWNFGQPGADRGHATRCEHRHDCAPCAWSPVSAFRSVMPPTARQGRPATAQPRHPRRNQRRESDRHSSSALDAGAVVGAVQTTDELFGVEYQSAFSTDDAVVKNLRPDPGDGSLRVFEFRSLYIAPGVSFTLARARRSTSMGARA